MRKNATANEDDGNVCEGKMPPKWQNEYAMIRFSSFNSIGIT